MANPDLPLAASESGQWNCWLQGPQSDRVFEFLAERTVAKTTAFQSAGASRKLWRLPAPAKVSDVGGLYLRPNHNQVGKESQGAAAL